jgi:hypothetical protein
VTDEDGEGLPQSLDEPVLVVIYDMRSGDELERCQDTVSLKAYLESIKD